MSEYSSHWDDMSEYLVHFTKDTLERNGYENMVSIYAGRVLERDKVFGIAKGRAPDRDSQRAVCFSEIPLHLLSRLAERRGSYGIGFHKKLMIARGATPVWYLEKDSPAYLTFQTLVDKALMPPVDPGNPIWRLTPLVDAPGDYPTGKYRFEWEREWRLTGDFKFSVEETAFLIIPDDLHTAAEGFFQDAYLNNLGPAYFCPFIDPYWEKARIEKALGPKRT